MEQTFNLKVVQKNLNTFINAYGITLDAKEFFASIEANFEQAAIAGILLRNPVSKQGLISCWFPVGVDITNCMLWPYIKEKSLEALPLIGREKECSYKIPSNWRKSSSLLLSKNEFSLISQGDFTMNIHHDSFATRGVIESYDPEQQEGVISKNFKARFIKQWCLFEDISKDNEVTFIPVISHTGLQARGVKKVK